MIINQKFKTNRKSSMRVYSIWFFIRSAECEKCDRRQIFCFVPKAFGMNKKKQNK